MKTEKVFVFFIVTGLLLTFFHIPGGKVMSILSLSILSFMYFPFGFYFLSDEKIDNKTVAFSIASGLLLSTLVIGTLFNAMHWPGARFMLVFGLLSCTPIAVISYLKYSKPKEEKMVTYYKNIFIRTAILIGLGLLTITF